MAQGKRDEPTQKPLQLITNTPIQKCTNPRKILNRLSKLNIRWIYLVMENLILSKAFTTLS